jgi:hypothetical protein
MSTALSAAGQPHRTPAGQVMADLANRPDGVIQREVAERNARLDHLQHQRRGAYLEHRRGLTHVGVADDHVQPAVFLGVGVRLVSRVDDRPAAGGSRRDALPDVLGALAQAERRSFGSLQDLAGTADQLAGDQERQQYI